MKKFGALVSTLVLIAGLAACTTTFTHQLGSGSYQLSIKDAPVIDDSMKTVEVAVNRDAIVIKNRDNDQAYTGKLDGDRFHATLTDQNKTVELTGVLSADNTVEGDIVQKEGDRTEFSGKFSLVPSE